VSLDEALGSVEQDLRKASPVSLADIASSIATRRDRALNVIRATQCRDSLEKPLVPVVSGAVSVALQGSITDARAETGNVSPTPSLQFAVTVTRGQQQQVTLPILFVSALGLADFYLGIKLGNLANMPDANKAPYIAEFSAVRDSISTAVNRLVAKGLPGLPSSDTCKSLRSGLPFPQMQID
jgi:hypothetical protein